MRYEQETRYRQASVGPRYYYPARFKYKACHANTKYTHGGDSATLYLVLCTD
jgi:hypothetical protein